MDLYFSCSLTGGRDDQPVYAAIVAHLQARGHRVLSAHLASPTASDEDGDRFAEDVFRRDTAWIRACEAVVAEVTTPSHGVGFEIAYALERGRPILCLARHGVRVSKMITGIVRDGFAFRTYRTSEDAVRELDEFLTR